MLFAQIDPAVDGSLLIKLLLMAGVVVGLWNGILQLSGRKARQVIEPQPLEVRAAAQYAPVSEVLAVRAEHERIKTDLKALEDRMRRELKEDLREIYAKVNTLSEGMSAVNQSMEDLRPMVATLNASFTRWLEQRAKD